MGLYISIAVLMFFLYQTVEQMEKKKMAFAHGTRELC